MRLNETTETIEMDRDEYKTCNICGATRVKQWDYCAGQYVYFCPNEARSDHGGIIEVNIDEDTLPSGAQCPCGARLLYSFTYNDYLCPKCGGRFSGNSG